MLYTHGPLVKSVLFLLGCTYAHMYVCTYMHTYSFRVIFFLIDRGSGLNMSNGLNYWLDGLSAKQSTVSWCRTLKTPPHENSQ
jgi:hypothetical protein